MTDVNSDATIDTHMVRQWAGRLKEENLATFSVLDQPHNGRLLTTSDDQHQNHVGEMIHTNHLINQMPIATEINISQERVHFIITKMLCIVRYVVIGSRGCRHKNIKYRGSKFAQYEHESEAFLQRILGMNHGWIILTLRTKDNLYIPKSSR